MTAETVEDATVWVRFGPKPAQVLQLETAEEVLRRLHKLSPANFGEAVIAALTGDEMTVKSKRTDHNGSGNGVQTRSQ